MMLHLNKVILKNYFRKNKLIVIKNIKIKKLYLFLKNKIYIVQIVTIYIIMEYEFKENNKTANFKFSI